MQGMTPAQPQYPASVPRPGPLPSRTLSTDACGRGLSSWNQGAPLTPPSCVRHASRTDSPAPPGRRRLRADTATAAGIMLQMPDSFCAGSARASASTLPTVHEYGARPGVPPREAMPRRQGARQSPLDRGRRGTSACSAGATCPSTTSALATARAPFVRRSSRCSSGAPRRAIMRRSSASSSHRTQFEEGVDAARHPENKFAYIPSLSSNTLIKRACSAPTDRDVIPDMRRSRCGIPSWRCWCTSRFSTQHVPVVAAGNTTTATWHTTPGDHTERRQLNWIARARVALCAEQP